MDTTKKTKVVKVRKTIKLRLYKTEPYLRALRNNKDFNLAKSIAIAITNYANHNDTYKTIVPKGKYEIYKDDDSVKVLTITLSDPEAIRFVNQIPKGYKNGYIKNIVLASLASPIEINFTNEKGE